MTPAAHHSAEMIDTLLRSKRRILRFLERDTGSKADAEDVLQAALVKVVARSHVLRDEERLQPWFTRILRNELADHLRRRAAVARLNARLARDVDMTSPGRDALAEATCTCLSEVLTSLPPRPAELIRRLDLDGEALVTVAQRFRISHNAASVGLHRARRALRRALLDFCRLCATHARLDCGCGGVPLRGSSRCPSSRTDGAKMARQPKPRGGRNA